MTDQAAPIPETPEPFRTAPYLERVDEDDGEIRFEIHSAHEEDGWMIVFAEHNDRYAKQHAEMMMALLMAYWPRQFVPGAEIAAALKHFATPAQPAPAEGDWVLAPREPVDASKQRPDFEEWAAREFGPELPLNRVPGHWDYESEKTHAAWCAWWSARLTAPRAGATWAQQQSADDGRAEKAGSATSRTCRCEETRRLVDNQALDAGLWFISETAAEAYLQQELRRLHAVIEGSTSDEIAE